jgi:DNA-binding XRE family transcriptional regulator
MLRIRCRLKVIIPISFSPAMSPDLDLYLKMFGESVRQLRKAQGISQEKLAELADLHRTYIGGVERGERNVSLINILKLSRALRTSPSELMKGIS